MKRIFLQEVDMDLSSTQHSQSIFSLDATICPKKRLKMRQLDKARDVPIDTPIVPIGTSRSSSSSSFQKKKIKISKNHASISKLGAFGHASSILKKKRNHIFLKSQGFQNHASICRLGAFNYASFR